MHTSPYLPTPVMPSLPPSLPQAYILQRGEPVAPSGQQEKFELQLNRYV